MFTLEEFTGALAAQLNADYPLAALTPGTVLAAVGEDVLVYATGVDICVGNQGAAYDFRGNQSAYNAARELVDLYRAYRVIWLPGKGFSA